MGGIKKDDRVYIRFTNKCAGLYPETIGCEGIVVDDSRHEVSVMVDMMVNNMSKKGLFWYERNFLIALKEKENKSMSKLLDGYRVALVRHTTGCNTTKKYSFAYYGDKVPREGQLAVTDSKQVVIICDVLTVEAAKENDLEMPTKQLIGLVDDEEYESRLQRAEKKETIKRRMDERIKELQKEQVYELFAEKDTALAELLNEYKEI